MTPKEKAEELFMKFYNITDSVMDDEAKECALIAIDEILKFTKEVGESIAWIDYWEEVKKEIEKL